MSDEVKHCVFCDGVLRPQPEPKKIWGQQEENPEPLFTHVNQGSCPRNSVRESQTYTEGLSDRRSSDF